MHEQSTSLASCSHVTELPGQTGGMGEIQVLYYILARKLHLVHAHTVLQPTHILQNSHV